jgi:UDP-N-acetylmuramoyl-L-alanyl-D-glutamate--2,6-diaminopimelate ligase
MEGTIVHLDGVDGGVTLDTQMVGVVNAPNVAAAYLAARAVGIEPDEARSGGERCAAPPGRFELVDAGQAFRVIVDYAHTPDSLAALIATARSIIGRGGHVQVVVGARGGRDRMKRPDTGRVAATADRVVLTTDSPGYEDPRAIIEQLRLGAVQATGVEIAVEPDRRRAIQLAVGDARPGDAVLIVGRGHEQVQHVAGQAVKLDDRLVARAAAERWQRSPRSLERAR